MDQIFPDVMYGCTQAKGWNDNRARQLWNDKVWKLYLEGTMRSALLLDPMKSHNHPDFIHTVDELGTRIITIPGGLTSMCQPFDLEN